MQKPQKAETNPEATQNPKKENLLCCFARVHHLTTSVIVQIFKLDLAEEILTMLVLCSTCTLKFRVIKPFFARPQLGQNACDCFSCTYASDCHECVLKISEGDIKSENFLVLMEQ